MSQLAFFINSDACSGCNTCQVACKDRHDLPAGLHWRRVYEVTSGAWQKSGSAWTHTVAAYHLSVACHHREEAACLKGCPSGAYEKRPDGVVVHHEALCLGCRYCEMTCPFATPTYVEAKGVMSKCHLCAPRVDTGRAPACVTTCPTEALRFQAESAQPQARGAGLVPGFADPAGCRPSVRFLAPAGARRIELFHALEEALNR